MKSYTPFDWNPPHATAYASEVDHLFLFMLCLCLGVFLLIAATLIVFIVRYRRSAERSDSSVRRSSPWLELTWVFAPLLIFLGLFAISTGSYLKASIPPDDAKEIFVVGKQWMWTFQHPEGPRELNEIHVPVGSSIKLLMISQDAIHSFYVPAFRIKQDVLPGRYTLLWFKLDRAGEFAVECAEYCGTDHARMSAKVIAMEPAQYAAWLDSGSARPSLASKGKELFQSYGCASCHKSSNVQQAPSLEGSFGTTVTLESGARVLFDENYLRESILDSQAERRAGYRPIMPVYAKSLSEEDVVALIVYIKSLTLHPFREPQREHED